MIINSTHESKIAIKLRRVHRCFNCLSSYIFSWTRSCSLLLIVTGVLLFPRKARFNKTQYLTESSVELCSHRATSRGFRQHVIAVSVFGPTENTLFQRNVSASFLRDMIWETIEVYPGWIFRVYHDNTIDAQNALQLQRQYDHVDLCNMTDKPFLPPRMWRYLPAGDPLVDIMISRDLDSPLTKRERSAVDAWLKSDKIFHVMRDHPGHIIPILAGMWGFRPTKNRTLSRSFLSKLQNITLVKKYIGKGDQPFLFNEIWPLVKKDSMVHDSFHCKHFGDHAKPFPTQRPSMKDKNIFVGCVKPCSRNQYPFGPCPTECRPQDHKEWIYC